MTPYQRGNRDGLLNLAAQLDADAAALDARYEAARDRLDRSRFVASVMHRETINMDLHRAELKRSIAGHARRLAEALPEDPEAALS